MHQLSPQDASFIYQETPNAPMTITSLLIFDPTTAKEPVTFDRILADIESKLHVAPFFRQRLVRVPMDIDHPYWINDANFDLEFHVRHIALPRPGDWRQLCIQAARIHSRPLDLTRPPWELYVIEGLSNIDGCPPDSLAYLVKTHHSVADGKAFTNMYLTLFATDPDASPPPVTHEWIPEAPPQTWELMARASANNAARAARAFRPARMDAENARRLHELSAPVYPVPLSRFNTRISSHRSMDGRLFDFELIRRIRTSVPGATVNDVVLALTGGAIRKYLVDKGDLPDDSLVAMVPVSVRPVTDEEKAGGNAVSAMYPPLGTHIADPIERLTFVRDATRESKGYLDAVGADELLSQADRVPGALVGLAARENAQAVYESRYSPAFNVVVTNVPGSTIPQYSCGARLISSHGISPIFEGMALFVCVSTYCGKMVFDITADPDLVPDLAFMMELVMDTLDEMLDASPELATAAPSAKKAPAKKAPAKKAPAKEATKQKATKAPVKTATKAPVKTATANKPSSSAAAVEPTASAGAKPRGTRKR